MGTGFPPCTRPSRSGYQDRAQNQFMVVPKQRPALTLYDYAADCGCSAEKMSVGGETLYRKLPKTSHLTQSSRLLLHMSMTLALLAAYVRRGSDERPNPRAPQSTIPVNSLWSGDLSTFALLTSSVLPRTTCLIARTLYIDQDITLRTVGQHPERIPLFRAKIS